MKLGNLGVTIFGGFSYLGGRATLSYSSFFGRWFQVEGVMDVGFSILWQESRKIEKRFSNLMFDRSACARSRISTQIATWEGEGVF